MNGYKAFYRNKTCEVYANSAYEAQKKAAAILKPRKTYEVSVMLCEKEGKEVVHTAVD